VSPDDRQPWELADKAGRPHKKVPPTSKPIDDEEERDDVEPRTHGNGAPSWNEEEEAPVTEEENAPQYADEDAEEHSDPKGPAGGAGGPR
jgi:hypothetical protein